MGWRMTGSNRRPPACKAGALPAELILQNRIYVLRLAATYSCRDKVSTTIGAEELNYCVRDGNRCDLFAIATRQITTISIIIIICLVAIAKRRHMFPSRTGETASLLLPDKLLR